ncbi:MAG: putative ABC transporter permease [Eubacteriales bacterium]|nr:putative ABC transporter permease [Eubacteriales bacterium]
MQYTYYELIWLFLIYSLIGWCAGVAVAAVKRKKFINTGVLNLPVCPVYGISAVAYTVFLSELKEYPLFLFLGGMVLSAVLTVITGIVLQQIFHREWWDYSKYRIGFHGYITVPLLLFFGAAAIFVLWVGNPLLLQLIHLMPYSMGKVNLIVIMSLLGLDLLSALAVVGKWRSYIKRMSGMTDNMQKVSETFGNAITSAIQKRLERSYPNLSTEKILQEKSRKQPAEEKKFAEGSGFYKLVWLFLIGSFFGDLVETVFCRITMGWWMSRSSVVYGPFSIVWGFACALLTALMYRYRNKSDRYLFFYGTIVGGTYEYVCSVLAEIVFGAKFWDYSKIPFNLGGRVNLLYCFFWGIVAVLWLKGIYPLLSKWIEKIPKKIGPVLTWVLIVLMTVNMAISALALDRYSKRQRGVEAGNSIELLLDEHFPDERMMRVYPKAKLVDKQPKAENGDNAKSRD